MSIEQKIEERWRLEPYWLTLWARILAEAGDASINAARRAYETAIRAEMPCYRKWETCPEVLASNHPMINRVDFCSPCSARAELAEVVV